MKKILGFLALSFAFSSAWAGPARVGSWQSHEGQRMNETMKIESFTLRTEVIGYETVNGQDSQKRKEELTVDGQAAPSVSESFEKMSVLTSDQAALTAWISNRCVATGGVIESITVKAGTFETCRHITSQKGVTQTTWVGPVAGGIVKGTVQDFFGTREFELTAFEF